MVCGIGNHCKIITSVACAGNLAAINDFSTQGKPGGLFSALRLLLGGQRGRRKLHHSKRNKEERSRNRNKGMNTKNVLQF
jgi:hypothetical protein